MILFNSLSCESRVIGGGEPRVVFVRDQINLFYVAMTIGNAITLEHLIRHYRLKKFRRNCPYLQKHAIKAVYFWVKSSCYDFK